MRYFKLSIVAILTITTIISLVISMAVSVAILVAIPCAYLAYKLKMHIDLKYPSPIDNQRW